MYRVKNIFASYFIGATLGVFAGATAYYLQPIKWKGQVLIRIGYFSQSIAIEPLANVVERLKSRSFINDVAERANRDEIKALLNIDEDAGMVIRPIRNGDSIEVVVVGNSAELVKASLQSVVAELKFKHDALLESMLQDKYKEITRVESEIGLLSERLADQIGRAARGRSAVSEIQILATQGLLEQKIVRAYSLRDSVSTLNRRPTSEMETISVFERRFVSSLWRICLAGALLGAISAGLLLRFKKVGR